jgi:hypothetical protein
MTRGPEFFEAEHKNAPFPAKEDGSVFEGEGAGGKTGKVRYPDPDEMERFAVGGRTKMG